jgi:nucleoside-diphosphate-sugar epimerase
LSFSSKKFPSVKILVTGGGGFLGRTLVQLCQARGHAVRSFSRAPHPILAARGVEVFSGDLADPAAVDRAVAGCDAVFHVAAKAGVWGPWHDYFSPNVLGTQHILAACHRHGVSRLVYTSTPSVVFDGQSHAGADESLPYGQKFPCHYPHTKALAEQAVLAAHDPARLRVTALRPHLIWGAGDPHLVPRILARAHRLRIVGDGANRVDLTHVRHAAAAHLLALDALTDPAHPAGGRAYFISDGAPVVLWEWINTLLHRLGRPAITRRLSLPAAHAAGALLETLWRVLPFLPGEPPMTRFVATELAKDHWYSIAAARRDLGFIPSPDLTREMDELVASLRREAP